MRLYLRDEEGLTYPWWTNFLNSIERPGPNKKILNIYHYVAHRERILRNYVATFHKHYLGFETKQQATFFVLKYS